jgi:hypothetical protein
MAKKPSSQPTPKPSPTKAVARKEIRADNKRRK